ncbi:hypothetical protein HK102_010699, partial [Quaeritorhiza haematococci]
IFAAVPNLDRSTCLVRLNQVTKGAKLLSFTYAPRLEEQVKTTGIQVKKAQNQIENLKKVIGVLYGRLTDEEARERETTLLLEEKWKQLESIKRVVSLAETLKKQLAESLHIVTGHNRPCGQKREEEIKEEEPESNTFFGEWIQFPATEDPEMQVP